MPNYGDLALCLPPNWKREEQSDQNFALSTVGHVGGLSDARLKEDPDALHAFGWVPARYLDTISRYRSAGFVFVKAPEWEKNPDLWEWDGENFLVHEGARLMALPEAKFRTRMAARRTQRDKVMGKKSEHDEEIRRLAIRDGISISEDEDDAPRRRGRRARI